MTESPKDGPGARRSKGKRQPAREYLDVQKRRAEKQAARDEDARRLACGEVTREELALENGLFSSPAIENMRIIRRWAEKDKKEGR